MKPTGHRAITRNLNIDKCRPGGKVPFETVLVAHEHSYVAKKASTAAVGRRHLKNLKQHLNDLKHQLPPLPNIVYEGVAGVGKTYDITHACRRLAVTLLGNKAVLKTAVPALVATLRSFAVKLCSADLAPGALQALSDESRRESYRVLTKQLDRLYNCNLLVVHPSTSYEEMVISLRPAPAAALGFIWKPGTILRVILDAQKAFRTHAATHDTAQGLKPVILVLDEINRCNLPSVLGELMLAAEPSRRMTIQHYKSTFDSFKHEGDVDECWSRGLGALVPNLRETEEAQKSTDEDLKKGIVWLPENLYIIGTMNSSDRSILGFDQALRRRFPPKRVEPYMLEQWQRVLVNLEKDVDPRCIGLLATEIVAWSALNAALRTRIGPDAMIGHSYLFSALTGVTTPATERFEWLADELSRVWRFGILPQVIHAAESAREETFAQQLFDVPVPGKDVMWRGKDAVLAQGLKEVGVADAHVAMLKDQLFRSGVGSLSLARAHRIVNAGIGHGERLLLKEETGRTHPTGGNIEMIKNAADYVSLGDDRGKETLKGACRLLDRRDSGELAKRLTA